jgi:hypothetical protein
MIKSTTHRVHKDGATPQAGPYQQLLGHKAHMDGKYEVFSDICTVPITSGNWL